MALFLYEFLYRGRPPGASEPPSFHVVLGSHATDDFGRATVSYSEALTPEQAAELGFGLPEAIAAINVELAAEINAVRRARDEALAEVERVGRVEPAG